MLLKFVVITSLIGVLFKSTSSFRHLLKSPSVKIPTTFLSSETKVTPSFFSVTSINASFKDMAISLKDALIEVTEKKLGVTLVSDDKKVVGIFTDGDLRRCLNDDVDLNKTPIKDVMTTNFKSIKCNDLAIDAAEIMEKNKIFSLVVNSSTNQTDSIGIITMHQLLEAGII